MSDDTQARANAAAIGQLIEQLGELQLEFATLKAGIADERWRQVGDNFAQLSANLEHLDKRVSALESR